MIRGICTGLLFILLIGPLHAQEEKSGAERHAAPTIGLGAEAGELSITKHRISVAGKVLNYTVTAGYMPIRTEEAQQKAAIFFMAYTLDGVKDPATRPITYSFNGGPGSSSVWLHLGALGPKRVLMGEGGEAPPPPYSLVDNEYTWLDLSDLVFIDPVGTGYSRPAPGEKREQFHGVEEDIRSVGEFIRLYTTQYERWASPKFLAGESYGTTRAAGLAAYLQDKAGMDVNGLILVSSILQFSTARFDPGNDWPYILFLPTYSATAWYHKQLEPALQQGELRSLLDKVEQWAMNEYLLALAKGDRLSGAEREAVAGQLARFTGLDKEYILAADLRPNIHRFCKELLREERRTVGRLDSRFSGIDRYQEGEYTEHDPSLTAIMGPYTACLNDYVRRELAYKNDLPYEILTGRVHPWNWGSASSGYVNMAEGLREAMSKNTFLQVFIANGYYDLATPYFATEFTLDHMNLEAGLKDNIRMTYYDAGHMMYINIPSLVQLKQDISAFYRDALAPSR